MSCSCYTSCKVVLADVGDMQTIVSISGSDCSISHVHRILNLAALQLSSPCPSQCLWLLEVDDLSTYSAHLVAQGTQVGSSMVFWIAIGSRFRSRIMLSAAEGVGPRALVMVDEAPLRSLTYVSVFWCVIRRKLCIHNIYIYIIRVISIHPILYVFMSGPLRTSFHPYSEDSIEFDAFFCESGIEPEPVIRAPVKVALLP